MTAQVHGKRSARQNFGLVRRFGKRLSEMHADVHTVHQKSVLPNTDVQPFVRNGTENEHRVPDMRFPETRKRNRSLTMTPNRSTVEQKMVLWGKPTLQAITMAPL